MLTRRRVVAGWGVVALAAVLVMGIWAVANSGRTAQAQQAGAVAIGDNTFTPRTLTVPVGTTVVWTSSGQRPHTVTSDTGAFDSGQTADKFINNGGRFQFTFSQAGTFPYYCVLHGSAGGGGMAGTVVVTAAGQAAPAPTTTVAPPPPAAQAGETVTVQLGAGRDGSQPGTATLTAMGNQTQVVLNIQPGAAGVSQPAHIHSGSCPNVGAVVHPLTNVADGKSTTMVNASLSSLRTGGFAINVHKSSAEVQLYTACGNITAAAQTAVALPRTGDGSSLASDDGGSAGLWYALIAGGALLAAAGGVATLRKARARS